MIHSFRKGTFLSMSAFHIACVRLAAAAGGPGDLFEIVIGTVRWPIVVIIGLTSSVYTAYGGLYVSIITDQAATNALPPRPLTCPCCAGLHCVALRGPLRRCARAACTSAQATTCTRIQSDSMRSRNYVTV